jgi:hypothetical protein
MHHSGGAWTTVQPDWLAELTPEQVRHTYT